MTKDWVWAQARAGRIPHVQLVRYRRFRQEALEEWLDELERRSSTSAAWGQPSADPPAIMAALGTRPRIRISTART